MSLFLLVIDDTSWLIHLQRVLETQLSTTRNTIDLLKLEIEREEALLAKETKYVEEMEKNAKKAEIERRRQMKNVRSPSSGRFERIILKFAGVYRNTPFYDISMIILVTTMNHHLPHRLWLSINLRSRLLYARYFPLALNIHCLKLQAN